jgi:hypothetical protein
MMVAAGKELLADPTAGQQDEALALFGAQHDL